MRAALRWVVAGVLAVACAAAGVLVASEMRPRVEASSPPVTVRVTATATAHPFAEPAPIASPPGIDLTAHSIDDPASIWVVANKQRPLNPVSYTPDDLTNTGLPGGKQLTAEAAKAAQQMYAAAKSDGAAFTVSTAYRSYGFQKTLFNQYVASRGVEKAETFSARPGYSEHQTGLTFDVYDSKEGCRLEQCFGDTSAGRWLTAHAADYGFIERYPEGSTDITGYKWEPWHWRYVGVELAQYMRDQHIATLEEVFNLPPAPSY